MAVEETFVPPASSPIAAFTYFPEEQRLLVEFVGGGVCEYKAVDPTTARHWQQAGGSERFFYQRICDCFPGLPA